MVHIAKHNLHIANHNTDEPSAPNQPVSKTTDNQDDGDNFRGVDAVLVAYMWIFHAVQTDQETSQLQAKELSSNASQQNRLIDWEAALRYQNFTYHQLWQMKHYTDYHQSWRSSYGNPSCRSWYTYRNVLEKRDPTSQEYEDLELKNQQVTASRGLLEDQLSLLKSGSSIQESDLNTTVNEVEQKVQQNSSIMTALTQIYNLVSRI